jgi:hypothetical protein
MRESFHQIDALLREAPAFQSLAEGRRREVATDLAVIANFLAPEPGPPRAGKGSRTGLGRKSGPTVAASARSVDLPDFVRALLSGTFQAVVDASVEQMEAYAELVAATARSVDQLRADADSRSEVATKLERALREVFPRERGPSEER